MRTYTIQFKRLTTYSIGGQWYYRTGNKCFYLIDLERIDKIILDRARVKCNSWVRCNKVRVSLKERYNRQVLRRV